MKFEIPCSVELRNALGGLLDIQPGGDRVLYADYGDEIVPVATVSRYPGCPVETYEKAIKMISDERED